MLLGKRHRHPMKRTTSMTEFSLDISTIQISNDYQKPGGGSDAPAVRKHPAVASPTGLDPRFLSAAFSPRNQRRNSGEFLETAHFMRACGLCNRRLGAGRDIFMYRGDSAFCSLECRQQQMNQDERKEKCSLASMKKESSSGVRSEAANGGETVAAS